MSELRHLRYFAAVARALSFSRASESLHIAQPSLSLSIRQLEDELGVVLFDRTSRRVQLTAAGRVFYEEAQRTLDQMSRACRSAQRAARGEQGRLAIGFVTSAIAGSLRTMISKYRDCFPQVELELRELLVNALVEQLHLGVLDLICTDGEVMDGSLQSHTIASPPWVVAMHKSHRLAHRRAVCLKDLAREHWVVATNYPTHNLHDAMLIICRDAGFVPDVRHSADSVFGAVSMVSAKLGVAMVYELPGYHPPEVVYKKVTGPAMKLRMQICWKRGQLSPTAVNFVRLSGCTSQLLEQDGEESKQQTTRNKSCVPATGTT